MPNKIDLSGRFAVVTGGAQGIGKAIVERFLDSGATVAIWDRDKAFAEKTAKELNNRGKVIPVAIGRDRSDRMSSARDDTVRRSAASTSSSTTPASRARTPPPGTIRSRNGHKVMRVNLDGPFLCCRALVPGMIAQNTAASSTSPRSPARKATERVRLFGLEGGRHRADQIARQGTGRLRHRGERHHAGGGEDRDLRPGSRSSSNSCSRRFRARASSRSRRSPRSRPSAPRRTIPSPPARCSTFPAGGRRIESG